MSGLDGGARLGVIAVFTLVETVGLGIWLALVADAPTLSTATALGLGLLFVALVVEHVLTGLAVNGPPVSLPGLPVLGFSASETVLWGVWLLVVEAVGGTGGLQAGAVLLAALLVPQHTVEDNVLRGRGALSDLLDLGTLGFSAVEAVGATLWLALQFGRLDGVLEIVGLGGVDGGLVGLAVLAAFLFVEHRMGVRFSSRG